MAEISLWERLRVLLRTWVIDHWRGRLSLVDSFWINCFFVNLGAGIVLRYVVLSAAGVLLLGVCSLGVSVWQLVGLWRSAVRNGKKQPFWSAVVKGVCVLNVVVFVSVLLAGLFGGLEGLEGLRGLGEGGIHLPLPSRPSSLLET